MSKLDILTLVQNSDKFLIRNNITSSRFCPQDLKMVIEFVENSTPSTITPLVHKTLSFHSECMKHRIDDGRKYWKFLDNSNCVAIIGFHNRIWDPSSLCWGGWFCAAKTLPSRGKLGVLGYLLRTCLETQNIQRILIEVYGDEIDSNVYQIYKKLGFQEIGTIRDFYGANKKMITMSVDLVALRSIGISL